MTEGVGYVGLVGAKLLIAGVTAHWLGLDKSIQVLLVLMGLDIATGMLIGISDRKLNYNASARGIAKKAGALIIILAVHVMTNIANNFPLPIDIGAVVGWFYVLSELISIVDNCAKLGVPIPPILLDWIAKAKSFQEKKQAAAIEKVQAKAQEAVDTAKQAQVAAKDAQKATDKLIEAMPVAAPKPEDK